VENKLRITISNLQRCTIVNKVVWRPHFSKAVNQDGSFAVWKTDGSFNPTDIDAIIQD
jgi:hypothetical protein